MTNQSLKMLTKIEEFLESQGLERAASILREAMEAESYEQANAVLVQAEQSAESIKEKKMLQTAQQVLLENS